MKTYKVLSVVFALIAIIGLISLIAGTRNVNFGAFVFPTIFAVIFALLYVQKRRAR